jgi:hypothetical protein
MHSLVGMHEDAKALVHRCAKGPYFLSFAKEGATDYEGKTSLDYWKVPSGDNR